MYHDVPPRCKTTAVLPCCVTPAADACGLQALSKDAFAESLGLADVPELGADWEATCLGLWVDPTDPEAFSIEKPWETNHGKVF